MPSDPVEWVPVEQLLPHPGNFKNHTEIQRQGVQESLERFGWLKTLLWNRTTGHLLNGHLRADLWPSGTLVPVWAIAVSPEQERAILLEFDRIGRMRELDPLQQYALLVTLQVELGLPLPPGYSEADLATLEAQIAVEAWKVEPEGSGTPDPPKYQRFGLRFTPEEHQAFQDLVAQRGAEWGLGGLTPVVLRAIRGIDL